MISCPIPNTSTCFFVCMCVEDLLEYAIGNGLVIIWYVELPDMQNQVIVLGVFV